MMMMMMMVVMIVTDDDGDDHDYNDDDADDYRYPGCGTGWPVRRPALLFFLSSVRIRIWYLINRIRVYILFLMF